MFKVNGSSIDFQSKVVSELNFIKKNLTGLYYF